MFLVMQLSNHAAKGSQILLGLIYIHHKESYCHTDAQKLGKQTVLHSIRPIEQVFVYSTPRVRRITPLQTHSSILHIEQAFILFLNVHIILSYFLLSSYCNIFSNYMIK